MSGDHLNLLMKYSLEYLKFLSVGGVITKTGKPQKNDSVSGKICAGNSSSAAWTVGGRRERINNDK